jgi:hypothetical protein
MLLADRVSAIVELSHDAALRRDDWPCARPEQLSRNDVAALVSAVLTAADSQAASPLPAMEQPSAERSSWHVASPAHAVPASS